MHSGYIDVSNKDVRKEIFYMLHESQRDPVNDPLIIWFNGGPGCSSMYGAFLENSPYLLQFDKNDPQNWELVENANSWNKEASVLYIDQPAGVGFSVCEVLNE